MNSVAERELSLTQLERLILEAHTSEQKIINQTALWEANNELTKLMDNYDETMSDAEYVVKRDELFTRQKRFNDVIQKINNNTWNDRENPILIAKIADLNDSDKLKKTRDYYKYIYKQDANTTYISPITGGGNSLIFKLKDYLIKIIIISPEKGDHHIYKGKTIQTATEQDFNKEVRNQETVVSTFGDISPTIFYTDILNASQISFLKINNPSLKCGVIVMELVKTESLNSFMCRVINPKYRIRLDTMTTHHLVLFLNEDDDALKNSQETIKLLIAKYVAYLFCVGMIGICHGDYGFNNAIISKHNNLVLIDYGRSKNMTRDLTREWINNVFVFIRTPTKEKLLYLTQRLAQINLPIFTKEELTDEQIETYYGWFVNPDIIDDAIFTDVASILKEKRRYIDPRDTMGGKSKSKRTNKSKSKSKRTSKKNKKIGNKNKRTNKPKRKTNKDDKKII